MVGKQITLAVTAIHRILANCCICNTMSSDTIQLIQMVCNKQHNYDLHCIGVLRGGQWDLAPPPQKKKIG